MSKPYFCAVIGKGFGDEGKGMAVDFLSSRHDKILVIRHNGGAQSGHTVELPDKRFVFHELSSGSFRRADTLWTDTYLPDLYKLEEELFAFEEVAGFVPCIYAQPDTAVTIIDDVLLNMAAEETRGASRHGSCGMGIYEAQCRKAAGFAVTIGELFTWSEEQLVQRLLEIRRCYLLRRLAELGLLETDLGEYGELLKNMHVLENVAGEMLKNLRYIRQTEDVSALVADYDCVIFENGQGLLLDSENEMYSPHVTASRTGLTNPCEFLRSIHGELDEVVYVTRSYVTRHGAGPLPHECDPSALGIWEADKTNLENAWQGRLRYARHEAAQDFIKAIETDLKNVSRCNLPMPKKTLLITHLNETDNQVLCCDKSYSVEAFCSMEPVAKIFDSFLLSSTRFSKDIILHTKEKNKEKKHENQKSMSGCDAGSIIAGRMCKCNRGIGIYRVGE